MLEDLRVNQQPSVGNRVIVNETPTKVQRLVLNGRKYLKNIEMENSLKSIVYVTVNTVNNKIYIGVHITETPWEWDRYWGCGVTGTSSYHFKHPKTPFQKACKKYGLDSFRRYTLFVYDTYEAALAMERQIVNEEFIKRPDTYNVALGGGRGLVPSEEIEVHQYDLEGNYIKTFRSISDAGRKNNVSQSSIHHAIITKGQSAGYYWSETRFTKLKIDSFKKSQSIPVFYYDKTGKYVGEARSMSEMAKQLDTCLSSVQKAVKRGTLCSGFYVSLEQMEIFPIKKYKRNKNLKIYQYSLAGEFLSEFENLNAARKALNKKMTRLSECIIEKRPCENYLWSYEKLESFPIKPRKEKQVAQYDLDGNLIKIWPTFRSCQKEFSNVRFVLSGVRSQTKGYKFEYIN